MPVKTIISGNVQNAGGNPATSGTVVFQLQPDANNSAYRVTGTAIVAPNMVTATIDSNGDIKAENGTDPLELWGNDSLQPSNTWYEVTFFPDDIQTQTWNLVLIYGTTYDLMTPQFYNPADFVPNLSPPRFQQLESNIVPAYDSQYSLGTDQKYYASAYIRSLFVDQITAPSLALPFINVHARGVVSDYNNTSGTDNKTVLDALVAECVAAGGGTLWFPASTGGTWYNGTWTIECSGIRIIMDSVQYNMDEEVPTKQRLVFTGAGHGVRFTSCFGLSLWGFQVDGKDVCTNPIIMDRVYLSRIIDLSVYRVPISGVAWTLKSTVSTGGTGTNWTVAEGINLDHVGIGMHFTGIQPTSGSFLGAFCGVKVNFTGAQPVLFEECDTTTLRDCFFYRVSGSGTGPRWYKPSAYQVNNIHLDRVTVSGNSLPVIGWVIDAGVENPGRITGFDESNGASVPAVGADCNLIYETLGTNTCVGRRDPFLARSGALTRYNGTFGQIIRDDAELGWGDYSETHAFGWGEKNDFANLRRKFFVNPDGTGYVNVMNVSGLTLAVKAGISPGTDAAAFQTGRLFMGSGVPADANGANGDFYLRTGGTAAGKTCLYHREGGVWVAVVP